MVQGHGEGTDHNLLSESQAGQQSGFGGITNDCKVTEKNVTQAMLSVHGNRRSGYKLRS